MAYIHRQTGNKWINIWAQWVSAPQTVLLKDICGQEGGTQHRGHYMIDVSDYDGRRNKTALWINSRRNKRSATLTSLSALLCFCSRDVQSCIISKSTSQCLAWTMGRQEWTWKTVMTSCTILHYQCHYKFNHLLSYFLWIYLGVYGCSMVLLYKWKSTTLNYCLNIKTKSINKTINK